MRKPGYIALVVLMAATIALTGCSNVTEAKGTGHHNNDMLSSYVKGACAIYVYQGVWYAVENFALEESENSGGTLSCNAYGPEAEEALNEYIDSHDW